MTKPQTKNQQRDFPFPVPDYRFHQQNEMFKRRTWDDTFIPHGDRFFKEVKYQDKYGFRKLDYAFRNASWSLEYGFAFGCMKGNSGLYSWDHISDKIKPYVETGDPVQYPATEFTRIIKKAAGFYGASLVGTCYAHPNLIYSHEFDMFKRESQPLTLPEDCTNVVVMAVEMDYQSACFSPDAISGASTGLGYSKQSVVANLLANFIRGLGYKAIPCGNDTALSVPLALAAGLGELGRMGLLVTQKYGPRVRLCKVFTNLPLSFDTYKSFGVSKFCDSCQKCAKNCPSQAIPSGAPTDDGPSTSNFSGTKRWYINPEKCFVYWAQNRMDCNNCVKVCPFNKPTGVIHDTARALISRLSFFNPLLIRLDDWLGYGKSIPNHKKDFWET